MSSSLLDLVSPYVAFDTFFLKYWMCSPPFNFSLICILTNLNDFSVPLSSHYLGVVDCEVMHFIRFVVEYHISYLDRV